MNVWRLKANHQREHVTAASDWSRHEGVISIGHGSTKDLRNQTFNSAIDLARLVRKSDPYRSASGAANDGKSMWNLYHEVQRDDLIIFTAHHREFVMRVVGDYYFVEDRLPYNYEHRRKAEIVSINPNNLWKIAGGRAGGESIFSALIRCAKTIDIAEYKNLLALGV